MPPPPGYVGFMVFQPVVMKDCVKNYTPAAPAAPQPAPPAQPPSVKKIFDVASDYVTKALPGWGDGFSFFEMIIQLNNLNGAKPIPAGDLIVSRIKTETTRTQPCDVPRTPGNDTYYEKFGNPIDFQVSITGCKSKYSFKRVMEYAIIGDPDPNLKIIANENALRITPTATQIATFDAAITLRLTLDWDYNHCDTPDKSVLKFNAETFDPNKGGQATWSLPGGPLSYTP
jgi:hypothetical protein